MPKKLSLLFIILAVFLVSIASLPLLLSTRMGKSLLIHQVNKRISGTLEIDKLSLGWFSKQKLEKLSLKDLNGESILTIKNAEIDGSLINLFINHMNFHHLQAEDINLKIVQDRFGATNLEEIAGLKVLAKEGAKTPVYLENAKIFVKRANHGAFEATGQGSTRQNSIEGQFSFNASSSNQNKISLTADHFPTLVLDQSFGILYPHLSGILLASLGDSLDVNLNQTNENNVRIFDLLIKSSTINADLKGEFSDQLIRLEPLSAVDFSLPIKNIEKIQQLFDIHSFKVLMPLDGKILIDSFGMPLINESITQIFGKINLSLEKSQIIVENSPDVLDLSSFNLTALAEKDSQEIAIALDAVGQKKKEPISFGLNLTIPKRALTTTNLDLFMGEGIGINGHFKSHLPLIESSWKGIIRETHSKINMSFISKEISLPEMIVAVPFIPFQEIFEDGEIYSVIHGHLSIKQPQVYSFSPVDEISIPWTLDFEGNSLKLNLTGKKNSEVSKQMIRGSIRVDHLTKDMGINFTNASLQVDLKLEGFETKPLQEIFPDYPLDRLLGSEVDADLTASRDLSGSIIGQLELSTADATNAFLKWASSSFTMQNKNQDVTFNVETQQAIGATKFEGTVHDLFDSKGVLNLTNPSVSIQGNLKHFPVGLMTKLLTGDEKIADNMEAIFGTQIDGNLQTKINNQNGPVQVHIKGLNGQFSLNAEIVDAVLLLIDPLTASLKVTPQLEHAILREYLPLLGSVVSAEKPIELTVPVAGFKLPLKSESLTGLQFENAELKLDKMQFLKESPLGKIVSVLGVQSPKFDVWFTPIYFSLKNMTVRMKRTDMLVANAYPLAGFGSVDLNNKTLDLTVGVSGQALIKSFNIKNIDSDMWLQIPIKGTTHDPKIDIAKITAQVAALAAASKAGSPGPLMGIVIEAATDLVGEKMPPPTTQPLPWVDEIKTLESRNSNPNKLEEIIERPVDELKKGAKKLLKNLFEKK